MTPRGGGVSPSSKQVKLGNNYGDLPTPTKTGYNFGGWYLDGTKMESTTQNTTIGDHTLSASWTAKTYTVYKGGNMTGVSVSASSSGTFNTTLSFSTSGSSPGYNYSFSSIKIYSGSNTTGTLLATFTSTSDSWTMTGTYYSSIYIYAEWSRTAIPTTISASPTIISYRNWQSSDEPVTSTITAGGGGGKWVYTITSKECSSTSSSKYESLIQLSYNNTLVGDSTGEVTTAVVLYCNASSCTYVLFGRVQGARYIIVTVRATSVYNGTYAEVRVLFRDESLSVTL